MEGEAQHRFSEISLHIWGSRLNPGTVTESIGFAPTESHVAGQEFALPSGRSYAKKTGQWTFITTVAVKSSQFQAHLDFLLEKLAHIDQPLLQISGVEGAFLGCIIGLPVGGLAEEFAVSHSEIARLSSLGLGVKFTFMS